MPKPRKPFDPQPGREVEVFRNLATGTLSVIDAKTKKLIGHTDQIELDAPQFRVSEAGRQRVLRAALTGRKKKNVHALVRGRESAEAGGMFPVDVTYNPYKYSSFVRRADESPIFTAKRAAVGPWGVKALEGIMENKKIIFGGALLLGAAFLFFRSKPTQAAAVPSPLPPAPPPPPPDEAAQPKPGTAETKGPKGAIPAGATYTVKQGESLANIAERTYGNYRWWPFIWDRNAKQFQSPDLIQPGQSIQVPSKAELPIKQQAAYFKRAQEHAKIWAGWKGKGAPVMPASVLYPGGKPPAQEMAVQQSSTPSATPVPQKTTEQMLTEQAAAMKAAGVPTGGRPGLDKRSDSAQAELEAEMSVNGFRWMH